MGGAVGRSESESRNGSKVLFEVEIRWLRCAGRDLRLELRVVGASTCEGGMGGDG